MVKNIRLQKVLRDYLWIVVGSLLAAAAINIFLVPYKIAPGGVTGIATVVHYLSGFRFPVGATMLVLNIPLFIFGLRYIGKNFLLRTLFGTFFLSLAVDMSGPFTGHFVKNHLSGLDGTPSPPDLLLYSIFGGLIMGLGMGLVFKSGATTGGTDLAARVVNHFAPAFTMGQILLFIDASVVIFAAVSFNSFQLALYAIVTLFVSSKVIDVILEGVNFAKALFIISNHPEKIAERIMTDLDRGVTVLKGKGMYTGNDKQVLFCVVHRAQIPRLKNIVREIDPAAFIVLTEVREVLGEGFKTYE
jgi:uncharacterized membrane-anchored protein YitT (DUF2179 family)